MSSASVFAAPKPAAPQSAALAASPVRNDQTSKSTTSESKKQPPFSKALLEAPPHPKLKSPKLHVVGLAEAENISDEQVMSALVHCLRARPKLDRSGKGVTGFIEFEHLLNAEKALATVQNVPFSGQKGSLSFSIDDPSSSSPPSQPEPLKPEAQPRLVRQLPQTWSAADIFELFRVFGPVHRVLIQLDPSRSQFTSLAVVEFFFEEHAAKATTELHFSEQQGQTISVHPYEASKGPKRLTTMMANWVHAPEFYPAAAAAAAIDPSYSFDPMMSQQQQPYDMAYAGAAPFMPASAASAWASSPPAQPLAAAAYGPPNQGIHNPVYANPGSSAPADPCNLFLKNLDSNISSQDIFQAFKRFGHIVSARVMRDENTGDSKGFGFVSFSRPEDAATAKTTMDNQPLHGQHGHSTSIIVRFHEPKRLREQKMRERFSSPRARPTEFDREQVLEADACHRLSGIAPPGSPQMPGSPQSPSVGLARHSSLSSSGSGSHPAAGQVPLAPTSERDRLAASVERMGIGNTDAVVGLLMTLSKKERALCLFNSDVLRSKVADAQSVLEASEGDEGQLASKLESVVLQSQLPTPQSTPERRSAKGSRGPSPGVDESGVLTTASLAKMPAVRIIEMVSSENPPPVAAAPSPPIQEEVDSFIDSLQSKPINEQKQKLGERLFKKVKELGFKGAPKLTIHLLDNEDLRALAHLMAEQPEILKEKVSLIQLK